MLLLVILYSQVLSGILVSGDRVILYICFLFIILRRVKCKKKSKCRNDQNIYEKNELESTFIEIVYPKKSNIIVKSFTDIHPWILLTLIAVT